MHTYKRDFLHYITLVELPTPGNLKLGDIKFGSRIPTPPAEIFSLTTFRMTQSPSQTESPLKWMHINQNRLNFHNNTKNAIYFF